MQTSDAGMQRFEFRVPPTKFVYLKNLKHSTNGNYSKTCDENSRNDAWRNRSTVGRADDSFLIQTASLHKHTLFFQSCPLFFSSADGVFQAPTSTSLSGLARSPE